MTRNLWGWGKEADAESLDTARVRAEALFGDLDVEEASPPRIPPPRVPVPESIAAFSSADPLVRASHAMGKSYVDRVRGFRGDFSSSPDVVAFPGNEAEVVAVFEAASRERLAVVPFGGGSSVVGGVEALAGPSQRGVVTVDLSKLDGLLAFDPVSRAARFQAGVFGPSLEQQLAAHGFTLRHFPQSFEYSTLGGWIVTRAGGHFATVYTHIDDLVQSVRMVSPGGMISTHTVPASGAGPDANRFVLGSEGAFGIVTEATVRVRPRPVFRAGASVHFDDFAKAVEATRAIAQSGLFPANCRLLDGAEAMLNGASSDGSSVLVLGFESADHDVAPSIQQALALTSALGGTCPKGPVAKQASDKARAGDAADQWRASFLRGPYLQDAMIRLGVVADTFETACTWSAFPALYDSVREAMQVALEGVCGGGLLTCRFTHVYPDGPAPYFTFLGKARRGDELAQWTALKKAASDALASHGGTITHHHAVGRTHRPWYDRERSPAFGEVLRAVKRTLDPEGLLNPGVLVD